MPPEQHPVFQLLAWQRHSTAEPVEWLLWHLGGGFTSRGIRNVIYSQFFVSFHQVLLMWLGEKCFYLQLLEKHNADGFINEVMEDALSCQGCSGTAGLRGCSFDTGS